MANPIQQSDRGSGLPKPARGEIWLVDWSPARGSEQMGRGPALIVQTDPANRNPRYPNTIVAAMSRKGREVPTHVKLATPAEPRTSFVKCEQLMTVSKARLLRRMGNLERSEMEPVERALRIALEL